MNCYPCVQNGPRKTGAGDGTRTRDLLITNQLLYQLSYAGVLNSESYHLLELRVA
jgi:hypothetical protein